MRRPVVQRGAERRRGGQALGWLVAAVAVLAAVVLIVLLARANDRVATVEGQGQAQVAALQRQLRGAEARARLTALQASLRADAEDGTEAAERQLEAILADLREAYADAEGRAAQTWEAIRDDLEGLGAQLRDDRREAAATLERVLERLRTDAETP